MPLTAHYLRIGSMKLATILCLGLLLPVSALLADDIVSITSASHKTGLLELFTSEGCSSCPPADKWLGSLADKGYQDETVIPVAFHVDYWDYLGWRDIYAEHKYSERQHQHVVQNRLATAYTPQLILDGKNLRPSGLLDSRLRKINSEKASVNITLRARSLSDDRLQLQAEVSAVTDAPAQPARLMIAVVTDKIVSSVGAGENSGRTLNHYHVSREMLGPFDVSTKAATRIDQEIRLPEGTSKDNSSIIAFVETDKQEILQAVRLQLGK